MRGFIRSLDSGFSAGVRVAFTPILHLTHDLDPIKLEMLIESGPSTEKSQ